VRYKTKYKLVNVGMLVLMFSVFGVIGLDATHNMFAQTLPPPTLELSLPKERYQVGESVAVILSNTSAENAYVMNNCPHEPLSVTRLTTAGWVAIQDDISVDQCAGEARDYEIPANRSVRVSYDKWQEAFSIPGTYRIHAAVEPSQQGPTVQFTVSE
jgi:hypothetical protein